MSGILGRSQFVSETANLFMDEKTANARARVSSFLLKLYYICIKYTYIRLWNGLMKWPQPIRQLNVSCW